MQHRYGNLTAAITSHIFGSRFLTLATNLSYTWKGADLFSDDICETNSNVNFKD